MLFGAYRSNVMTDTPLLQATSSKLKAQPLMSIPPPTPTARRRGRNGLKKEIPSSRSTMTRQRHTPSNPDRQTPREERVEKGNS